MPVTHIRCRWDEGTQVFHEYNNLADSGNVLSLAQGQVTVGDDENDVNFSWLGLTTGTFDLDAEDHTLVTTGLDWTITGDIDLIGNITVDVGDVQIGDNDYLMFGDGAGGDVSARWVSATSLLEWLPLTDATGAFVIGNGTKNIDFKVWGGSGAGYYLLYDESEDDLILAGVNSQLELESTVNSTTTATGSIHTLGGLGVALNSFFGGTLSVGTISAINAAGPSIVNVAATTTVPTLCPNRADLTTGLGWAAAQLVTVISGAAVVTAAAATVTFAQKIVQDDATASTDTSTGSIQTDGGLGVAGRGNFGGIVIVTSTDATTAGVNAIYGYNDAGATWTSGNQVGVRGKTTISGGFNIVSATGVWAGLDIAAAWGAGSGLTCALNAEVSSNNAQGPNAIVYIQSLPGAGANFATVPYLVFSETAGGTGSNILFEVGHAAAATVPTLTSGTLFYQDTLQIAVNLTAGVRTAYYIPLSTAQGTYTTAYPIVSSLATGAAIDITAPATGIDIGTCSAYAINFTGNEGRILMGTDTTTRASFAATGDVVQFFTVNMAETGICTGLDFEHSLGFQGNTAMQATAVRGVLRILTGTTVNGTSKIYEGASGYALVEGTVNSASIDVAGVRGVIMDGGVWTAARSVACGWFDWQLNNALAGITNTSLLLLTNNANQGAENPDNVMYLFTPYMKYLLNFQAGSATGGEIIAAGGSGGATRSYKIKCKYEDTEFYLSGYTD